LAEKGYDPDFGARPLARLIQVELKDRIVDDLLFGDLSTGGRVRVDRDSAGLTFDIQPRS
jgi:ATP-dependent Clp protease ATP-binding subunit ClpA